MEGRKKQSQTIKKVLTYIKQYRMLVLLSLLFAAVTVFATLYFPILTGDAVDLILAKGLVDFEGILAIIQKAGIMIVVTAAAQWFMNVINNRITYQVIRDIREEAFQKIEKLPLKYLDGRSAGEIVSRVIADVDQFADGLLMGFTQLFTGLLTIVGTLGFMVSINITITIVVVVVTPVSLFVAAFIAKNTDLEKYSLRAIFFSSITNPSTRFVNSLVYTGVAVFGALAVIRGNLSVGQLSCFLSYANQYTKPFNEISGVITELQNALACASGIFDLIEQEPQIPDRADARVLEHADGSVALEHVTFSYTPEQKLIEDFNLAVRPSQRIAIVGPTGCGKTTMINLLMRFYDPNAGVIRVSGTDIRDITRKSLRGSYGMVLQETWLRSGTIRDNICMGRPDASVEEMVQAAKAAHAHSFIKRLPDGYDTVISEDGGNLSQGQKQLLCIARVMLCLPPMLILDEATSSIDTRTEMRIQKAFAAMMQGRTSFIVAHRLSTIESADVILVMKDGKIIEQGSHQELLKKNGFYATLYKSQFAR